VRPRGTSQIQRRARYARNPQPLNDLLVNSPDGFNSGFPPIAQSTAWWWGSDILTRPLPPAESLAAVQRATNLIATTVGGLPCRLLTGGPSVRLSRIEAPPPRWLSDPMLHRPDDRFGPSPTSAAVTLTRSKFWSEFIRSALLRGRGCMVFEEDASGIPIAGTVRLLNPDMVAPAQDGDGPVIRRIGVDDEPQVETDRDGRFVLGNRLFRLMELLNPLSPVDEYGSAKGVLELCQPELAQAVQMVRYGSSMFRSGVPSGYLKVQVPAFNKERSDQLRAQWDVAHGTGERQTAVLNATTDYVPIQMSPVDMNLVRSRQMALMDIANAFGVPVYSLGGNDGGSNTYSNAESRNRDFILYSLTPWIAALEDVLTSLVPVGQYVTVDTTTWLKADTATRFAAWHQALEDGWLTPDEIRLLEGLPPLSEDKSLGQPNEEV
jgi:HK97 family phage portal protein